MADAPPAGGWACPPGADREFRFTAADFDYLRGLASRHTGIVLNDDKFNMVYSRLSRRIRALKLDSFADYCVYLERHEATEIIELVNALTTNLTAYFREQHHFDYLRDELVPRLRERNRESRRIRVWSAGCATGEEAYSIAITLAEAIGDLHTWDVKILASDIDSNVLRVASDGIYDEQRTATVTPARRQRWFARGRGVHAGKLRVNARLRELVQFHQLNLLQSWPVLGPFDAVFCRNVIIYFDMQTKRRVVERFADLMHEDSRLFLGHSESLFRVSDRFSLLGNTIYRKVQ